ncbi:MAG: hypothetical protein PHH14_08130, partial [Candidatus Margulisbacteria bacterium]|nr:hypothetical protein [Candidatus Margulisiibacteriota bacterium]
MGINFMDNANGTAGKTPNPLIDKETLDSAARSLTRDYIFFTASELAWQMEQNYRVPLSLVLRYLDELCDGSKIASNNSDALRLKKYRGKFYCRYETNVDREEVAFGRAQSRDNNAYLTFRDTISFKKKEIAACRNLDALWAALTDEKYKLGLRGIYLLTLENDELAQRRFTSNRDTAYRTPRLADGLMRGVIDGTKLIYHFLLAGKEDDAATSFSGIRLSSDDRLWVIHSLQPNFVRLLDLIKLVDADGVVQGLLMARNPIYFGEERQAQVDDELLELGHVIANTLARIRSQSGQSEGSGSPSQILIPRAAKVLTEDLRFNPDHGLGIFGASPYPRNASEFFQLLKMVLNANGKFNGDQQPLIENGFVSPRGGSVVHRNLVRNHRTFRSETFAPFRDTPDKKDGVIFLADLLSQIASWETYKLPGVMYDKELYYNNRFWHSEKVPFVWLGDQLVSFAAMQGYQSVFQDKKFSYAFIHFVMTLSEFQGYGLTSYSIREGMSSIFYSNIWHGQKGLIYDEQGQLSNRRFQMLALAHSGRFPTWYAFAKSFGGINEATAAVFRQMVEEMHNRITLPAERERRPIFCGAKEVINPEIARSLKLESFANNHRLAIALDPGVYPVATRYKAENGEIVFSEREMSLPEIYLKSWLALMGGVEGVLAGNGLYFGGLVNLGKISAAKKNERMKGDSGWLENAGNQARSLFVSHN